MNTCWYPINRISIQVRRCTDGTSAFQKVVELGLPRFLAREQADIFHGTDFSVPYLPLRPSVMTVFDLSPWRTGGSDRIRRRYTQRWPVSDATRSVQAHRCAT